MNGAQVCRNLHLNYAQFYKLRKIVPTLGVSQRGGGRGVQAYIFAPDEVAEMRLRAENAGNVERDPQATGQERAAQPVQNVEPVHKPTTSKPVHTLRFENPAKVPKARGAVDDPVLRDQTGREKKRARRVKGYEQTSLFDSQVTAFFAEPEEWEANA